jgi:hypothetical protein
MTVGLCRRLAAVLLTYRMTVGLCMDLAAVLLTYRMTVGLYMDLTAVLIKYHMTVGLRRHLAVLPEYVLVIGLRAWESFNMMGIIFGILHKIGMGKGHQAMVLCMEHGWMVAEVVWVGPKRNSLIYHQQRRLWSLEIGSIYVGLS